MKIHWNWYGLLHSIHLERSTLLGNDIIWIQKVFSDEKTGIGGEIENAEFIISLSVIIVSILYEDGFWETCTRGVRPRGVSLPVQFFSQWSDQFNFKFSGKFGFQRLEKMSLKKKSSILNIFPRIITVTEFPKNHKNTTNHRWVGLPVQFFS